MAYPNFLGIGAQKSASTWLHSCLKRHPDVYLPPMKEIHYFDGTNIPKRSKRQFRRIVRRRNFGTLWWLFKYAYGRPKNDAWYGSLFPRNGYKAVGEITPGYSALGDEQVRHVGSLMPDARIIFVMRNPVDRVWSAVRWHFGTVKRRPLETLTEEEMLEFVDRESTVRRTSYLDTMETWERHYPREQILYGYFEDIRENPEHFLKSICDFLSIEYDRSIFTDVVARKRGGSPRLEMPEAVKRHVRDRYDGMIHRMADRGCEVPKSWLTEPQDGGRD